MDMELPRCGSSILMTGKARFETMHEMSLVRNIVQIVREEAEAARAEKITAVHLVVGEGRDIVEHLVQSMFQFLARGTVAEDAEVILHHVPYMVKCNQCQTEFHLEIIRPETRICPNCGASNDYTLVSGQEFYISRIEATRKKAPSAQKEDMPE